MKAVYDLTRKLHYLLHKKLEKISVGYYLAII